MDAFVPFRTEEGFDRVRHPDGSVCCAGGGCGDCGNCTRDCEWCHPPREITQPAPTDPLCACPQQASFRRTFDPTDSWNQWQLTDPRDRVTCCICHCRLH